MCSIFFVIMPVISFKEVPRPFLGRVHELPSCLLPSGHPLAAMPTLPSPRDSTTVIRSSVNHFKPPAPAQDRHSTP
jgi:hypothetical protein